MTLLLAVLLTAGLGKAIAQPHSPVDAEICQNVADAQEKKLNLPRKLLSSISLVESGRNISNGHVAAWPWTINVNGGAHYYETADAAILAVKQFQAAGSESIDIGCNQISLLHHPHAFFSIKEAFDPMANASYAGRFLVQLYNELGSWHNAVAAYHSRTPELGENYSRRVMQTWQLSGLDRSVLWSTSDVNALGVFHNLHNYNPSFLTDARLVPTPPPRRAVLLAAPNPLIRPGRDQSWKAQFQQLAALGTPGG